MDTDEELDDFHDMLNVTLENMRSESEDSTPADLGLVLHVFHDIADSGNASRGLITLKTARNILDAKHTTDELCWFDIFNCVVNSGSNKTFKNRKTQNKTSDYDFTEFFTRFTGENQDSDHAVEFDNFVQKVAEIVDESVEFEDAERDDEVAHRVSRIMSIQSGFLYGEVEVPNNLSRMELVDMFTDIANETNDEDFRWMMQSLESWISMYVHAESMMASENCEHEDLKKYMINKETPAERYWS